MNKTELKKLERKQIKEKFLKWSIKVKNRDGNKCVICGKIERLNAHHLIPRSITELRFDLDCGLSLCPLHHLWERRISGHKNSFMLILWLIKNRPNQYERLVKKIQKYKLNEGIYEKAKVS